METLQYSVAVSFSNLFEVQNGRFIAEELEYIL